MNFENAELEPAHPERKDRKRKRAVPSENAFNSTKAAAEAKGMQVNASKTGLLCISDASNYDPVAFIRTANNSIIESGPPPATMKLLGFIFSNSPTAREHIANVRKKFRQRFWTLWNLKRNGFTEEELVTVYKSSIRPVVDYLDVVYHSMLTDDLDEELDRLQNQALKIIFGPRFAGQRIGGQRLRALAGITTLRSRRVEHCDKFASKCASSPRFEHWFPLKMSRARTRGAGGEKYLETFARCNRLRDSPVHFFRRRLNGKVGKIYGERYREYREDP